MRQCAENAGDRKFSSLVLSSAYPKSRMSTASTFPSSSSSDDWNICHKQLGGKVKFSFLERIDVMQRQERRPSVQ